MIERRRFLAAAGLAALAPVARAAAGKRPIAADPRPQLASHALAKLMG